jgi:hypothetical protein
MVLLGAAKGSGAPVRRWRPEARREVMVPQHHASDGWCADIGGERTVGTPLDPGISRAQGLGDAEGPELCGTNHRTGHGDGPYGCREAVITYVARFRAPADILCQGGGSGDVHGHDTGGWRRVNAEVCLEGASSSWRTANRRRRRLRVSETIRHPPKRPIADALTFKPAGAHPIHELFAFISSGFK